MSVAEHRDEFINLIAEQTSKAEAAAAARTEEATRDVIGAKQMNADNGLQTSCFTVCTRVRPAFEAELAEGGDNFSCLLACGPKTSGTETTEAAVVLLPTVSMRGALKLDKKAFAFDHTFGPASTDDGIFERIGMPLVARAKSGQVACIFAYGQTGSGKTHTIGNLLDRVVTELYVKEEGAAGARPVTFSYLELLGNTKINDCLVKRAGTADGPTGTHPDAIQIGELLDGRVEARNLSAHSASSAEELSALVALAKARRTTAATERNAQSSRSHGVGILTIGQPGEATPGADGPKPGVLLVIDLAGSERAADSKGHDKERLEETKAVNLSLMALKDCIRARTLAATPSAGDAPFVPYRRSKLTLLMKDVFDIGCSRLCSTVVLSCVSPLAKDAKHTINTLEYSAPLRVAMRLASSTPLEADPRDPAGWGHEQAAAWLATTSASLGVPTLDTAALLAGEITGLELCRLPEAEIHRRVKVQDLQPAPEASELASKLHGALWTLICDAKTRRRKPNGKLISDEEEAAEVARVEAAAAAKALVWKEREKSMAAESTADAASAMAGEERAHRKGRGKSKERRASRSGPTVDLSGATAPHDAEIVAPQSSRPRMATFNDRRREAAASAANAISSALKLTPSTKQLVARAAELGAAAAMSLPPAEDEKKEVSVLGDVSNRDKKALKGGGKKGKKSKKHAAKKDADPAVIDLSA